jgi:3-oxoadipate enol-lactonase
VETIALLPAGATTSRIWRHQADALADRFRVITPDLPGHGAVPGPFTLDRAVAEVVRHLDAAAEPVHLCGLSLSVTVAILTCLRRPDRVRTLVLTGGIAHPPPALAIQRVLSALLPQGLLGLMQQRVMAHATRKLPAEEGAHLVDGAAADFRAIGKRTYLDSLRELARADLRDQLPQIAVPALVLCGERDKVNLAGARDLEAGIPGATLQVIPGGGHLWPLEQPDLFTATLTGFVDRSR